jgi:hypothetical protein|tara:strand:+ start:1421 stop:1852 length:432 start_codon:yes stop_codon:yes gene_type:complete
MSNGTDQYGFDDDDPNAFNQGLTPGRGGSSIDFSQASGRKNRGSGIFKAVAENLKRRKDRDEDLDAKVKKAKQLASQYQQGAFQVNDETSVLPGYTDPGFEYTIPGSPGFGGLIGTVGGAVVGSAFGNPMMGANIGSKVGSYF